MSKRPSLSFYYENASIQNRIVEYLGGREGGQPSAMFITADDCSPNVGYRARSTDELIHRCGQLGIRLVLENMLPHLFFGQARDILWMLGALESTDVGICLDTGHAHLSGDLQTVVHKLSGHLWMIHASDNRGQQDDHLPPGEGAIAWHSLIEQLMNLHFRGTIILEIAAGDSIDDTLARARHSRQFLTDTAKECEGV